VIRCCFYPPRSMFFCWCVARPRSRREGERDLLPSPTFLCGNTPATLGWSDRKGRPQRVCCFSANVQIPLFGLPQGKSPGPQMKDQESNPRPLTPRPAALPVKVEQWVLIMEQLQQFSCPLSFCRDKWFWSTFLREVSRLST